MFARKLKVVLVGPGGVARPAPLQGLDNFAMRSFTGESRFDDTLPTGDGQLEVGALVPLEPLRDALEDWLRRKSYMQKDETLRLCE